jgi:hypothetical protein
VEATTPLHFCQAVFAKEGVSAFADRDADIETFGELL